MNTAIITGGAGQDATLIAQKLIATNTRCILVTRSEPHPSLKDRVCVVRPKFDDISYTWLQNLMQVVKPNLIFHMASANFSSQENSEYNDDVMRSINLLYPQKILEFTLRQCKDSCKLIVPGSVHQFTPSRHKDLLITEETLPSPRNKYADYKIQVEAFLGEAILNHGLNACMPVLFNHESKLRSSSFLIPRICKALASFIGEPRNSDTSRMPLYLNFRFDLSHANDIAEGMIQLSQPNISSGRYILGSGNVVSFERIRAYANNCYDIDIDDCFYHYDVHPREAAQVDQSTDYCCIADYSYMHRATGWEPSTSIEDILRELISSA